MRERRFNQSNFSFANLPLSNINTNEHQSSFKSPTTRGLQPPPFIAIVLLDLDNQHCCRECAEDGPSRTCPILLAFSSTIRERPTTCVQCFTRLSSDIRQSYINAMAAWGYRLFIGASAFRLLSHCMAHHMTSGVQHHHPSSCSISRSLLPTGNSLLSHRTLWHLLQQYYK
jgi:hypothetical protein